VEEGRKGGESTDWRFWMSMKEMTMVAVGEVGSPRARGGAIGEVDGGIVVLDGEVRLRERKGSRSVELRSGRGGASSSLFHTSPLS
jgi:hypothetical protein